MFYPSKQWKYFKYKFEQVQQWFHGVNKEGAKFM